MQKRQKIVATAVALAVLTGVAIGFGDKVNCLISPHKLYHGKTKVWCGGENDYRKIKKTIENDHKDDGQVDINTRELVMSVLDKELKNISVEDNGMFTVDLTKLPSASKNDGMGSIDLNDLIKDLIYEK